MTNGSVALADVALHDLIDAAQTIYSCCQHQSRVVDDILVLSKLAHNKLSITPSIVQPAVLLADSLKLYEREASTSDIKITMKLDKSYSELIDWAVLDVGRTRQILFNIVGSEL